MAKSVERAIKVASGLSKTGSTISFSPSSSVSFNSQKITNLATPTADTDAATKAYVDTTASSGGGGGAETSKAFGIFIS